MLVADYATGRLGVGCRPHNEEAGWQLQATRWGSWVVVVCKAKRHARIIRVGRRLPGSGSQRMVRADGRRKCEQGTESPRRIRRTYASGSGVVRAAEGLRQQKAYEYFSCGIPSRGEDRTRGKLASADTYTHY